MGGKPDAQIQSQIFRIRYIWMKIDIIEHDKWFGQEKQRKTMYRMVQGIPTTAFQESDEFHSITIMNYLQSSYLEYNIYPNTLLMAVGRIGGITSVNFTI